MSLSRSARARHLITIQMPGPRLESERPRARCQREISRKYTHNQTQHTGAQLTAFIYSSSWCHSGQGEKTREEGMDGGRAWGRKRGSREGGEVKWVTGEKASRCCQIQ